MWLFFILWLVLLTFPPVILADIIINEVYPNPSTGESEWVEIYNSGEEAVVLNDWQLWDKESSAHLIHQFTAISIETNEFLVITLQSVLNNSGDTVVLKNDLGQEIDQLAYSSSSKQLSWSRNPAKLTEVTEVEPTKGTSNLIPTPSPTPTTESLFPILSEVVACPDSGSEWVEIFNPHDRSINLSGISLRDNKNQLLVLENLSLGKNQYLVIELSKVLNNSGDSVSLISADNKVIDSFSYTKCDVQHSWVNKDGLWEQTSFITKKSANIFSASSILGVTADRVATISATKPVDKAEFLYPPSVLKPKLDYRPQPFPSWENIVFSDPPRLEKGALSVIISSSLLLIPGWIYVKKNQQHF